MEKKCFACADTSVNFDRRCVPVGVGRSKFKKKKLFYFPPFLFSFLFSLLPIRNGNASDAVPNGARLKNKNRNKTRNKREKKLVKENVANPIIETVRFVKHYEPGKSRQTSSKSTSTLFTLRPRKSKENEKGGRKSGKNSVNKEEPKQPNYYFKIELERFIRCISSKN